MGDEEPPRKKRRSKWDITPPEGATQTSSKGTGPSQGASVLSAANHPQPAIDSAQSSAVAAAAAAKINAMLASKGKLLKSDPPLAKPAPPTPTLLPPPASASGLLKPSGLLAPPQTPPTFSSVPTPGGPHYVQDKVFVGLEQAPDSFNVTEKLQGPGGSFLQHIAIQTGAKVFLRGRGSRYIEPTSGKESFEALHVYISHPNKSGLSSARKLSESLIETVKSEYETFKTVQQKQPPLGFGSAHGYAPPPPHGYVNHYQTFPPPGPGAPIPPPGATPPPGYPTGPGYAPGYQGQPVPPGPPGPPMPPGPNYGYFPPGGVAPPHSDPYASPAPPPPPHPEAFYHPYTGSGGAEFGGMPPPPHPGHFHPPPPSHIPPGPPEPEQPLYRPHNRSPEPPPRRKFTEQVGPPPAPIEEDQPHQHFSFSTTGSGSISSAHLESPTMTSDNGQTDTSASQRKFVEAPTNDHQGDGDVPDRNSNGVHSVKVGVVGKDTVVASSDKAESSEVMRPPSLPPPSKLKEKSADSTMPPPPSLPPRFAKASTMTDVAVVTKTAESAATGATLSVAHGNVDSAESSKKPAKQLSALVAYGDDSDSDADT